MTKEIKEKLKELVIELENHKDLSFRDTLMNVATFTAEVYNAVEPGKFEGKSYDEKLQILKEIV